MARPATPRPDPGTRAGDTGDSGPLAPLSVARDRVAGEREELVAERAAFERFARQVSDIDAETHAGELGLTTPAGATGAGRERVRSAYEATVMSLDHYGGEYGEGYHENVAAELGEEVATALSVDGGGFTPPLKSAVLAGAREACRERERFIDHLDDERDVLERSEEALAAIVSAIEGYEADPPRTSTLTGLDDALELVALVRQRTIHDGEMGVDADCHDLCAYLYADEPWRYPVLTAVTTLRERVEALREHIAYGR